MVVLLSQNSNCLLSVIELLNECVYVDIEVNTTINSVIEVKWYLDCVSGHVEMMSFAFQLELREACSLFFPSRR